MKKSPAYLGPAPADTYLLKSLDTFDFDGLNGNERLAVIPCGGRGNPSLLGGSSQDS